MSGILYLFFYAGGVKAMDLDFGFDYKVDNIFLDLYINNVPAVRPGYDVGTSGSMQSNFDFKDMLYDDRNNITFITHKVDKGKSAELKVLFKYWEMGDFTMPFEIADNGFILKFNFEDSDECELEGLGGKIKLVDDSCEIKKNSEGYTISVDFYIDYPELYRSKYIDEAVLVKSTDGLKEQLAIEFKKVYEMFEKKDMESFENYFSPSLIKASNDRGISIEKFFRSLYYADFSDPASNVSEFNLEDSKVYLTKDKKLFTLTPTPFRIINSDTKEFSRPILYFWLDKSGHIRIKQ